MTTGAFDILHLGHIHMLEEARKLGDELVVVVARDETVLKRKHNPVNPEEVRVQLVAALKPVDKAVLGHRGDIFRIVEELRPDIIALGFDQTFDEKAIEAECLRRGVAAKVVRLHHHDEELDGTRKIIQRIADRIASDTLYSRKEPSK
jgi:FAD synthetase